MSVLISSSACVQVIDADLESGVTLPHAGLMRSALADLGGFRPHPLAGHEPDAKLRATRPAGRRARRHFE